MSHEHSHPRTFGATRVNILAKITWPASAKRIWLRNVENHIAHSKSATSCSNGKCISFKGQLYMGLCIRTETTCRRGNYHFPAKVMPSWFHAFFKGLSVYILWIKTKQDNHWQNARIYACWGVLLIMQNSIKWWQNTAGCRGIQALSSLVLGIFYIIRIILCKKRVLQVVTGSTASVHLLD